MRSASFVIGALVAVTAFTSGDRAMGAGFALKEQSATAQGNAFAGTATEATDASYMFFNPAALGRMKQPQGTASLTYISPTSKLEHATGSAADTTPFGGSDSAGDIGADGVIPSIYGAAAIDSRWRVGLAVTVPFALKTEYDRDWVGRYHGVQSEVTAINVNPVVAFNPVSWLSVAGGVQMQHMHARLTNAVDFALISGAAPAGNLDGFADLDGNDFAFGFNLGMIAEPVEGTRLGIAYRSSVDHTLDGDIDFDIPAPLAGSAIEAAFTNTDAEADFKTPASLTFGAAHDITDDITIMGGATWTQWSNFDELRVKMENGLPDNVTEEEWDDQWYLAAGAAWRVTDRLTLRAGVAYDQKALDTKYRTPRIPDNDRYWISTGATFEPMENISISAGYTHIFIDDSRVRLEAGDPGNATRGNLAARYDSDIDIIAISGSLHF